MATLCYLSVATFDFFVKMKLVSTVRHINVTK